MPNTKSTKPKPTSTSKPKSTKPSSESSTKEKEKDNKKSSSKSKTKTKSKSKSKSKIDNENKETNQSQTNVTNQNQNQNQNQNHQIDIIDNESDYRSLLLQYDTSKNKSRAILTSYEKALIIGKRATQLSLQAQEYVDVKLGMTPTNIAEEELKQKKIPYILKRTYGNKVDYWKLEDLFIN